MTGSPPRCPESAPSPGSPRVVQELQSTCFRRSIDLLPPAGPAPQHSGTSRLKRGPALYQTVPSPRALRFAGITAALQESDLSVRGNSPSRLSCWYQRPGTEDRPVFTSLSETDSLLPHSRRGARAKNDAMQSRPTSHQQQPSRQLSHRRSLQTRSSHQDLPVIASISDGEPPEPELPPPPSLPPAAAAAAAEDRPLSRQIARPHRVSQLSLPAGDGQDSVEGWEIGSAIAIIEWNEPPKKKKFSSAKSSAFGRSRLSLYPIRLDSPSRRVPDKGPQVRAPEGTTESSSRACCASSRRQQGSRTRSPGGAANVLTRSLFRLTPRACAPIRSPSSVRSRRDAHR